MTRDGYEPVPAIVRDYRERNDDVPVFGIITDTVTFSKGWGDSGYRIETVEHDCPDCTFDRMIRRVDVCPEMPTEVRYWCCNPNCVHFVRDYLSHACHGNYPHRDTNEPAVFNEGDA
jgi:hypothetical protein